MSEVAGGNGPPHSRVGWVRSTPRAPHLDEVVSDVLRFQAVHSLGCCLCYVNPAVVRLQLTEVSKEVSRFFEERYGMTRKHLQIKTTDKNEFIFVFLPQDECSSWPLLSLIKLTSKPMGNKIPFTAALCIITNLSRRVILLVRAGHRNSVLSSHQH